MPPSPGKPLFAGVSAAALLAFGIGDAAATDLTTHVVHGDIETTPITGTVWVHTGEYREPFSAEPALPLAPASAAPVYEHVLIDDAGAIIGPAVVDSGDGNGNGFAKAALSEAASSVTADQPLVQAAARGIGAAQSFTDMLRPAKPTAVLSAPTRLRVEPPAITTARPPLPSAEPAITNVLIMPSRVTGGAPAPLSSAMPVSKPRRGAQATIPVMAAPAAPRSRAWASGFGGVFDVQGGPSSGVEGTTIGFAAGVERPLSTGSIGIALGYSRTELDNGFDGADADAFHAGLYAGAQSGGLDANTAISYTYIDVRAAGSDADGHVVDARAEIAYDLATSFDTGVVFGPVARIGGTLATFDDASANGTRLDGDDFAQGVIGAGMRLGFDHARGSANLDVMYERTFGDDTLAFTDAASFETAALVTDEQRLSVTAGIDFRLTDDIAIDIAYRGSYGEDIVEHGGTLGFTLKF